MKSLSTNDVVVRGVKKGCDWWRESWEWSVRELRNPVFWRDCAVEFLLNAVLLAYVGLALITNNKAMYVPTTTTFAVFAAFIVYAMLEGYGPFSGAVLSPTGCFSACLAGRISLARGLLYTVFQTMGTLAGSGIAYGLTPSARMSDPGGAFHAFNPVDNGLTIMQGLGVEGLVGFNMVFIGLSVNDRTRSPSTTLPNLASALGCAGSILAAGTFTCGLANPLIALCPAVLSRDFTNHWIYWVGPLVGAALATGTYRLMVYIKVRHESQPQQIEQQQQEEKQNQQEWQQQQLQWQQQLQ